MRMLQGKLLEAVLLAGGFTMGAMAVDAPLAHAVGGALSVCYLALGCMGLITRLFAVSQFDPIMQMREAHKEWRHGQVHMHPAVRRERVLEAYGWMDVVLEHADPCEIARVASNHELRFLAAYTLDRATAISTMDPEGRLFTLYNAVNARLAQEGR